MKALVNLIRFIHFMMIIRWLVDEQLPLPDILQKRKNTGQLALFRLY